jgi:hypothetical protein
MKTAASQNGRVSKTVSVFTDAAGAESLRLRFTVDIRMPIEALPSFRFVLNTIEGKDSNERILLRRTDGEALVIRKTLVPMEGVTVTAEQVDATLPDAEHGEDADSTPWGAAAPAAIAAEAGDVWLEMAADATLAAGRYSDVVRLATNHPEAAEIQIPYTIRVRPLIDARPVVVRLWTAPTTKDPGRSAIVTLTHYGDRKFSITGVEVSHPEIFTAAAYSGEPSTQQSIRTGLVEGLDAATLGASMEGWIRVTTDDPERPVIEVPVLVAPTRTLSRRPVAGER